MATASNEVARSRGHMAFVDGREWYLIGQDVYVAPMSAPVADVLTGSRIGRWECTAAHMAHFRELPRFAAVLAAMAAEG